MFLTVLTLLAASGPVVVNPAPQRGALPWDGRAHARSERLLRETMVVAHNRARRERGAAPLAWDEGLARDAGSYARVMAATGRFQHDPQRGRAVRQGENLFVGTRGAYSYAEMIGLLVGERRFFRPGRFPDVSRTGDWAHVGHYTQIVWPATQRVGCATAASRAQEYLVCRYFPAGNIVGVVLR